MQGSCTPEGNPIRLAKELHQRIQPEQGVWKSIDPIFGAENYVEAWMKPGYGSMAQLAGDGSSQRWLRHAKPMTQLSSRDALPAFGLQLLKTASQASQQSPAMREQGQTNPPARSMEEFDAKYRILQEGWCGGRSCHGLITA